jgi:hypothetical protein
MPNYLTGSRGPVIQLIHSAPYVVLSPLMPLDLRVTESG